MRKRRGRQVKLNRTLNFRPRKNRLRTLHITHPQYSSSNCKLTKLSRSKTCCQQHLSSYLLLNKKLDRLVTSPCSAVWAKVSARALSIVVVGAVAACARDVGSSNGPMALNTSGSTKMILEKAPARCRVLMVPSTRGNGSRMDATVRAR